MDRRQLGQCLLVMGAPRNGFCLLANRAKFTLQKAKMKSPSYLICSRNGLTLIEVIASLLIVSVMILGSVRALHLHLAQATLSRAKSNAVKAADDLLTNWSSESPFNAPLNSSGTISYSDDGREPDKFGWRTRVISKSTEVQALSTVRLELFQQSVLDAKAVLPNKGGQVQPPPAANPSLVSVDIVVYSGD